MLTIDCGWWSFGLPLRRSGGIRFGCSPSRDSCVEWPLLPARHVSDWPCSSTGRHLVAPFLGTLGDLAAALSLVGVGFWFSFLPFVWLFLFPVFRLFLKPLGPLPAWFAGFWLFPPPLVGVVFGFSSFKPRGGLHSTLPKIAERYRPGFDSRPVQNFCKFSALGYFCAVTLSHAHIPKFHLPKWVTAFKSIIFS